MGRMYEFMSASGNVIAFDLEKVYWAKSSNTDNNIIIHFGRAADDLKVLCVDFPTAQALVDDISKKKESYHNEEIGE